MHMFSGRDTAHVSRKSSEALIGNLDMTNKMCFLRTSDPELLLLALFLAGFCCWSNATDTTGKSPSIFDVLYFFVAVNSSVVVLS